MKLLRRTTTSRSSQQQSSRLRLCTRTDADADADADSSSHSDSATITTKKPKATRMFPILLQYEHQGQPPLEALIGPTHTFAQFKQAVRNAFDLSSQQEQEYKLMLHVNNRPLEAHNSDLIALYLQTGTVVHVSLGDATNADELAATSTSNRKTKSPRIVKLTKKMRQSWQARRALHRRSSSDVTERDASVRSASSNTLATTTTNHATTQQQSTPRASPPPPSPQTSEIPAAFLCPISLDIMADPVTAQDGVTYDRDAIEGHFTNLCKQQQQHDDGENNDDVSSATSNDSNDDDSIPQLPQHKRRFSNAILWSPMTREIISPALVPNRAIEQIMEQAVDNGSLQLSPSDWKDWQERRQRKIQRDRLQRSQSRSCASASTLIPEMVTVVPVSSSDEDNDDHEGNHGRPTSQAEIFTPLHDEFPADTLCQLVRQDRCDEQDRLGPYDSGLATVVAIGTPTIAPDADAPQVCAVGCCIARLRNDDNDAAAVGVRHCHRCQRAVCRDCRRTQVTDICTGSHFKPYEICIECTWQLAQVGDNDKNNPALVQELVLPRLVECWQQVAKEDVRQWSQQACGTTNCAALQEDIQALLVKSSNPFVPREEQDERNKHETGQAPCDGCSLEKQGETPALGYYPATNACLPLGLSFPTPSMLHLLQAFEQERQALEYELRPLIALHVHQQESQLASLYKQFQELVAAKESTTSPDEQQDAMLELAKRFQSIVNEGAEQTSWKDKIESNHNDFIQHQVCQFEPPLEKETVPCPSCTLMLRMCPFCRAGPFHHIPSTGCGNCGGGRGNDFEKWPRWDEVAGPH